MKNEIVNSEDPMKKWIKEAGSEFPGEGFHLSVLKKIEALPKSTLVYKPIISPLGWKLIFGFIFAIFFWSILMIPSQQETTSLFDKIPPVNLPSLDRNLLNFNIPVPNLSPQFLIGISAFFSLGFIMIWGTLRNKQAGV
ncbi:hypothetical protein B0E43_04835 [Algoriphagus sp. A40]|nr:hypothetical protein B0E43_04835 [Algoriphagus sp. A40]